MITTRTIGYYQRVVDTNQKAYGNDWRTQKYQGHLDRLLELQGAETTTQDDREFIECRNAIAEVFGKTSDGASK